MGTCIRQGDLFHSVGLHRNHVLATANTVKIRNGFGKNAGEWTKKSHQISKSLIRCYNIRHFMLEENSERSWKRIQKEEEEEVD